MKLAFTTLFLTIALTLFTSPSFAQEDSALDVHTNEPVAVPGHILSPGDYVFRFMETTGYPSLVRITSADGSANYGVYQVIPATRQEPDLTRVTLTEPDAGGVTRITSWFFPGETDGYRFVYSKKDVQKQDAIARNMGVQATAGL